MRRSVRTVRCVVLLLFVAVAGCRDMGTDPALEALPLTEPPGSIRTISFSQRVLPIFQRHGCTTCHGAGGGLTVSTVPQLLAGGNHGPAVVAGQADNSVLIKKLLNPPPFGARMPQGGPYLPDSTIEVLKTWIDEGALNN